MAARTLPAVQKLLESPELSALLERVSRRELVGAVRAELDRLRKAGSVYEPADFLAAVGTRIAARRSGGLQRVVNATGIVLHTNLGRAPLAAQALAAINEVAGGYCNLEYDLVAGRRGGRNGEAATLLAELTGAPAALVVNNNAAALFLVLSGLAAGGEVVVSRGELVEIGGAFRIPDIIAATGARLVEVGTTNRTRLADYAAAIGPATRLLLKVHPSNYRITGFTAAVAVPELAQLARTQGLPVVHDLGSGCLDDRGLPAPEPTLGEAVRDGADLVTCSGDKLLGGPQAGLVLGSTDLVAQLAGHPLMRVLRPGKLTLAALAATLRVVLDGGETPAQRLMRQSEATLQHRALRLAAMLHDVSGLAVEVVPSYGQAGGGSLPEERIGSRAVRLAVEGMSEQALAAALRAAQPPVIARLSEGAALLDMLTVADEELVLAAQAIRAICR